MSKMVVNVLKGEKFEGKIPDDITAHIYNTNVGCTANLERSTPLVELTMGGIVYLLDYSLSFRAGYVHTEHVVVLARNRLNDNLLAHSLLAVLPSSEWAFFLSYSMLSARGCAGQAEFTSAVELVVEAVLADDFVAPFLKSTLAPVHVPPCDAREQAARVGAGSIDLNEVFPPGCGEGGGKHVESVGGGVPCRAFQTETEALETARTSFRLALKAFSDCPPFIVGVTIIDYLQTCLGGVTDTFVSAVLIFPEGVNVGVAVEYYGFNAVIDKAFHYCGRTWRTAGVQQDVTSWHVQFQCLLLLSHAANLTIFGDCGKLYAAVPLHRWIEIPGKIFSWAI